MLLEVAGISTAIGPMTMLVCLRTSATERVDMGYI